MTRRTSRKLRSNGRSYATKYIDTVPRSMSRDSWLAKWGTPTNAKLKQIIEGSIHGSFLDSAKVVDQAGNVLATWTHSRLAKNSRRRSSLRRNSYKSVPAGRKVVLAFLDKHPASSSKLSTDGRRLDGMWMGGRGIAEWSGGKIVFNDLGSRSAQTVQRQIRRLAPASWLRPNSRRRSSRR